MSTQENKFTRSQKKIFRFTAGPFRSIILLLILGLLWACKNEQKVDKPNKIDTAVSKTGVSKKKETKDEESANKNARKKVKPQIVAVVPPPEPYPEPYPDPEPDPYPEPYPYPIVEPLPKPVETVDPILSFAEKMPEFPGGQTELFKYINANLQYPQLEKENGIQGNVYVRFTVTDEGVVKDPTILRGISGYKNFDREVIRVIKLMPNWIPGENQGKKVSVYYTMPIKFKLD